MGILPLQLSPCLSRFRRLIGVPAFLAILHIFWLPAARAWKPITHVYLANQALKDALNDGKVTIYAIVRDAQGQPVRNADRSLQLRKVSDYAVSSELLSALRAHPNNFWAGVLGPDAFPDLPTGQMVIHPPTSVYDGPDMNVGGHPDGSDAWLRYLWAKAHSPQWGSQQNLAFTFGFMCHAAGDLYAHTYINYYDGGIFDIMPPNSDNALRHITLEGYLLERTPRLEDSGLPDAPPFDNGGALAPAMATRFSGIYNEVWSHGLDGGVDQFIYANMMDADRNPELWDILKGSGTTKSPPWLFSTLRQSVRQDREHYVAVLADYDRRYNHEIGTANDLGRAADACSWSDTSCSATWDRIQEAVHRADSLAIAAEKAAYIVTFGPVDTYEQHWIDDIDSGLASYPGVSMQVANWLLFHPSTETEFKEAGDVLSNFLPTIASMCGAPDAAISVVQFASSIVQTIMAPLDYLKQAFDSMLVWTLNTVCKVVFGTDFDTLKAYLKAPDKLLDTVFQTGNHPPLTLAIANADMALHDPGANTITLGHVGEQFDWKNFAPALDTVQLIKIALMRPDEVNRLIHDISPGSSVSMPAIDPSLPSGTPPNVLVGFLHAMDGSNQFVPGFLPQGGATPGLMLARDRSVYQALFLPASPGPDPINGIPASLFSFVPNDTVVGRQGTIALQATEPATWSVLSGSPDDKIASTTGDARSAVFTCRDSVPATTTVTIKAVTIAAPQRQSFLTLTLLRDMILTPSEVDMVSGAHLTVQTNVAPLAPGRVVGHSANGPHGPITVSIPPVPGVTWRVTLASTGQDVDAPSPIRADGTFTAPMVTDPTTYVVRATLKDNPGAAPTTNFRGDARIRVFPPPPPIAIVAGPNVLAAGASRRFTVAPNVPVTWKIVGNSYGCVFGTPAAAPETTSARQDLTHLQQQLTTFQGQIRRARTAPQQVTTLHVALLKTPTPTAVSAAASISDRQMLAPPPPVHPTVQVAIDQRDAFLNANRDALIAHTEELERVSSTLTTAKNIGVARTITVQATATDGTGRTATATISIAPNVTVPAPVAAGSVRDTVAIPVGTPAAAASSSGVTARTVRAPSKKALFGAPYFVKGGQPFAVRVEKAAYSLDAYAIDDKNFYYCRPTERFLKLTLRVTNVSDQPQPFDYQTVTAHAIGSDDSDLPETKNWKALDTGRLANRTVAPHQELLVESVVTVEAEQAPKALSFGGSTFDLTDPANAVPALDARPEQPAVVGTPCPLAFTVGTVDSITHTGAECAVIVTLRNATLARLTLAPNNIVVTVYDEDGDAYMAQSTKAAAVDLAPNGTVHYRYLFAVPQAVRIGRVTLREKDSRVYVIHPTEGTK